MTPLGELIALPHVAIPLAGFKGPSSKRNGTGGKGRGEREEEEKS